MMNSKQFRRGFSLIELIAVMAIITIIITMAIPAASGILKGSQMTQAANMLTDQINFARQTALTKNSMVEVRFLRFGDPEQPGEKVSDPTTGKFRAIQIYSVLNSNTAVPVGKVQILPPSVMLNNTQFSNLLPQSKGSGTDPTQPHYGTPQPTDPPLPRNIGTNYDYYSFRFLPDGSTSLQPATVWYVTLNLVNDLNKLQAGGTLKQVNFFTLQIDPVSGATKSYRPTAI